MESEHYEPCTDQVLMALKALKKASKDLESNSNDSAVNNNNSSNSPSMKALLTLQTGSDDLFSGDPRLSALSLLLSRLKSLASSLSAAGSARAGLLRHFLPRRAREISRVAGSIGSELQSWIDRESAARLSSPSADEDERCALLLALEACASRGFDHDLQDVLLHCNAYSAVESALTSSSSSKRVRDGASRAVLALVRFNKDVFVGPVLMGPAIHSLVSAAGASPAAMKALTGLIAAVRSPVVDELHARGEIPRIAALLGGDPLVDDEVRVLALDAVLEIGYHGRKEAIDGLLEEGIVERLMALQRSELGGALVDGDGEDEGVRAGGVRKGEMELRPFAGCVARFAVQMEVGEGLRQRERRAVRVEVVRRVRAAAAVTGEEAEAATVLAEVLWGSTCW